MEIETCFVAGSLEVNTGSCSSHENGEEEARNEAARIAKGLNGTVVEELPLEIQTWEWVDHRGNKQTARSNNLLRLAVVVDGDVRARVFASERL